MKAAMIKRISKGGRDEKVAAEAGRQAGKLCRECRICDFLGKQREAE